MFSFTFNNRCTFRVILDCLKSLVFLFGVSSKRVDNGFPSSTENTLYFFRLSFSNSLLSPFIFVPVFDLSHLFLYVYPFFSILSLEPYVVTLSSFFSSLSFLLSLWKFLFHFLFFTNYQS